MCTKTGLITADCTTNAACPTGQICDLSTMNYGKCITQIGKDYCGDGICGLGESTTTCLKDCGKPTCDKWWEAEKPATKNYGLFGWRHLISSPIETESSCVTAGWVYAMIAGGFIQIIVAMFLFIRKPSYGPGSSYRRYKR